MLTLLAAIYYNEKRLPEKRIELYELAVKWLLDQRQRLSPDPRAKREECLQALALHLMEHPSERGTPTPVGIYPMGATPEGVHDLGGNVWEWCADLYGNGPARVLRGGSFNDEPAYARAAWRYSYAPELGYDFKGFRCAWPASAGQE